MLEARKADLIFSHECRPVLQKHIQSNGNINIYMT